MRNILLIITMLLAGVLDLKDLWIPKTWVFFSLVVLAIHHSQIQLDPFSFFYGLAALAMFPFGWIGSMDVYFLFYMALFLDWNAMNQSVLIATLLALIVQKITKKEKMPFVTFLAFGFLILFCSP